MGSRNPRPVALLGVKAYAEAWLRFVMPVRLKKFIGTILLIVLVIVYALVATMVAVAQLAQSGPLVHLAFFFFSGLLWILPAMALIKWMVAEPASRR